MVDGSPKPQSKSSFKLRSRSKSMTSAQMQLSVFGEPLLLGGETPPLISRSPRPHLQSVLPRALWPTAVKPVDGIEEILIEDVMAFEWRTLSLRCLKSGLVRANQSNSGRS